MIIEKPTNPGNEAKDITTTFFKLRAEVAEETAKHKVQTGCPICSVYEALAKRGWMKPRSEADYKNHLFARHGLEP